MARGSEAGADARHDTPDETSNDPIDAAGDATTAGGARAGLLPEEREQYDEQLAEALVHDQTSEVRRLLSLGADPHTSGRHGWPAVLLAADAGQTEAVRLLLEHGADPNGALSTGLTAVAGAAREGHTETAPSVPI